jgi:hypothetical protein
LVRSVDKRWNSLYPDVVHLYHGLREMGIKQILSNHKYVLNDLINRLRGINHSRTPAFFPPKRNTRKMISAKGMRVIATGRREASIVM